MPSDWERVAADPELLDAARRRYSGAGDLADQLWWLEHPGERAPGGAVDPAGALAARRAGLYRQGADPDEATAVTRGAAALDADRAAARLAVRDAVAARGAPRTPSPTATAVAPRASSRGRWRRAGVVLVALAIGGIGGFTAGRSAGPPSAAALAVFDRRQVEADRPASTASLPPFVAPRSLRALGSSPTTGVTVYAARARDGRVCLIAVTLAVRSVATCTGPDAFARSGLSITLEATVDPEDDSGIVRPRRIEPTWSPEGAFTF